MCFQDNCFLAGFEVGLNPLFPSLWPGAKDFILLRLCILVSRTEE